jgi:hypothetical protein
MAEVIALPGVFRKTLKAIASVLSAEIHKLHQLNVELKVVHLGDTLEISRKILVQELERSGKFGKSLNRLTNLTEPDLINIFFSYYLCIDNTITYYEVEHIIDKAFIFYKTQEKSEVSNVYYLNTKRNIVEYDIASVVSLHEYNWKKLNKLLTHPAK